MLIRLRKKIISLIKHNDCLANCYFGVRILLISILRLFCKQNPNLVLFVSYGGKNISDSPKVIYDAMKADERFKDWTLVWGVINPHDYTEFKTVKIDSIEYFKMCLQAKVWITNSGITRYLNFKPAGNIFINTWHGIPMKKIGIDEVNVKKSRLFSRKWFEFSLADVNLACYKYDQKILEHVFDADEVNVKVWGLPRDDQLFNGELEDQQKQIKEKLGIASDKKVILYAPTVRGENVDLIGNTYFDNCLKLDKWQEELADYVILYRAHYYIDQIKDLDCYDNVIDVSQYDDLNQLLLVADILISDYSSIIFDYSILEKPIYLYTYDLEQYQKYQGLYFDPKEHFNVCMTQDELIDCIKNIDYQEQCAKTKQVKQYFFTNQQSGSAQKVLDYIAESMD